MGEIKGGREGGRGHERGTACVESHACSRGGREGEAAIDLMSIWVSLGVQGGSSATQNQPAQQERVRRHVDARSLLERRSLEPQRHRSQIYQVGRPAVERWPLLTTRRPPQLSRGTKRGLDLWDVSAHLSGGQNPTTSVLEQLSVSNVLRAVGDKINAVFIYATFLTRKTSGSPSAANQS